MLGRNVPLQSRENLTASKTSTQDINVDKLKRVHQPKTLHITFLKLTSLSLSLSATFEINGNKHNLFLKDVKQHRTDFSKEINKCGTQKTAFGIFDPLSN